MCGVGLLFLTSCVPRVEQSQDLASFLPFRVDLLDVTDSQGTTTNAGFWKIKPDEQVEISMQVQNLTSQAIRIDVSSPTFILIVNPVNQGMDLRFEKDLSNKEGGNAVRIFPGFYNLSRGSLETIFPASTTTKISFKVKFSQPGAYFVRGAMHLKLTSENRSGLPEVVILSERESLVSVYK